MNACVPFKDLLEAGQLPIQIIPRLCAELKAGSTESGCRAFNRQVNTVQGILTHTYAIAAGLARKTTGLAEIAEIWQQTGQFCQTALETLSVLKENHPRCSSPELYDLALDYKLACDKRYQSALEELECLNHPIPPTLFPAVS